MRGRHTLAILTRMGVTETIADSAEAYVDLAAGLAEPKRRAKIASRMAKGKARLYRDKSAVDALENFLETAVAEAGFAPAKAA
jgi:predicted O-linked N-acetylglucosamine transferase (SPINDLY family)